MKNKTIKKIDLETMYRRHNFDDYEESLTAESYAKHELDKQFYELPFIRSVLSRFIGICAKKGLFTKKEVYYIMTGKNEDDINELCEYK